MKQVHLEQIVTALESVGLKPGDDVLVHAALQFLGQPVGGPQIYLQALQEVLGPGGTIAVPTFNFEFARGVPYDPIATPSDGMGVLAETVRRHPEAHRSLHPMQSVALLGPQAADLASRDTPSAFDPDSAFGGLLALDFQVLLLGAELKAVSMVHYCEQQAGVPYRKWKDFSGQVHTDQGWEQRTYRMYVRDLETNPRLTLDEVEKILKDQGHWHAVPLNYGQVVRLRMANYVAIIDEMLATDPWALVIK